MEIRPATRKDFKNFYGRHPPHTTKAWVAEQDGEIIGMAGFQISGEVLWVWSDNTDAMTPRQIVKCAKICIDMAKEKGIPLMATPGPKGATLLEHFGFEQISEKYWRLVPWQQQA